MSSNWVVNQKVAIGIRTFIVVIILIYGWWVVASFRTQTFGIDNLSNHVIAATIFVLPFCIIPFIGLKSDQLIKCSISLFTAILFAVLIWGSVEEFVVTRNAPVEDNKPIVIKRWWPFEHHVIIYSPEIGWSADD
jgi:hypothetical protein